MIQKSYCLRSLDDIESCIRLFAASYIPGKQSILISIYTHWNKPETIRKMTRLFCAAFPEAEIAGMTTAGGIDHGRMRLRQTVVTIQFFEKSDVHTAIYDFSKEPMGELGEKTRIFCQRQKDLSALLLLMTQRCYDFEPFLTALDKLGKDIPICGGYTHTYRNEEGIYVFTKDAILSREALGHIERFAPEGMLLISCVTRRYYLKEDVNQILSAYNDFCVAPGGYVNGELIRIDGKTQATNMTLISVCFREGEAPLVAATRKPHAPVVLGEALSTIQRLATFVTETTKELAETQKQLSFAASHDSFTGLLNRGSIEEMLCRCHEDASVRQLAFSALMIDLDTFKHINDTFGHAKGDEVICEVASILKHMIRPTDFAGRWGGDEFVILLPGTTPPSALIVASRLQKAFRRIQLPDRSFLTASIGCTTASPEETEAGFYKRMDDALYLAKEGGRNRIILLDAEHQVKEVTRE